MQAIILVGTTDLPKVLFRILAVVMMFIYEVRQDEEQQTNLEKATNANISLLVSLT